MTSLIGTQRLLLVNMHLCTFAMQFFFFLSKRRRRRAVNEHYKVADLRSAAMSAGMKDLFDNCAKLSAARNVWKRVIKFDNWKWMNRWTSCASDTSISVNVRASARLSQSRAMHISKRDRNHVAIQRKSNVNRYFYISQLENNASSRD